MESGSYKNIKLSKNELIEKLNDYISINFPGKGEINSEDKKINHFAINLLIYGNKPALINVYEVKEGLNIYTSQGQNPQIGDTIIKSIVSGLDITEQKKQDFAGITESVYIKIKEYFTKNPFECIETKCSEYQINLTIKKNSWKIVLQYYNTTHKLVMSGYTTHLWDDVCLQIAELTENKANKIVETYLKTKLDLETYKLTYDDGILEELTKSLITPAIYEDKRILNDTEKEWFKTTAFFQFTQIQLPEYYPTVASSIKIIEGILNRIFKNKNPQHRDFEYFETNEQRTSWKLSKDHYHFFNSNTNSIETVENLYEFIQKQRHPLMHNPGQGAKFVTKCNALAIFEHVLTLLKKTGSNADILFS